MEFGKRLKQLRIEKHMIQKELAAILQVSVGTICNYEKNVHFPDGDTLCRIADFFQVSVDYLLGQTDCRTSIDKLNTEIIPGYTIGHLVNQIVLLDSQSQRDIRQYTEYLKNSSNKSPLSRT